MDGGVSERLQLVKNRVLEALVNSGRSEGDCELLVVSKTWPAERVAEVVDAGQVSFGENKVQEAEGKIPQLPNHLRWHLIGHLQRNKVRKALPLFTTLHGIDSLKLARYTSGIAKELNVLPEVYIQVNIANEPSKNGYSPDVLKDEIDSLCELDGIKILGLMGIPPVAKTPEDSRRWFVAIRELRDNLERRSGRSLPGLSMGMSGDYEVAIQEGSTVVRVGSAIFGARQ